MRLSPFVPLLAIGLWGVSLAAQSLEFSPDAAGQQFLTHSGRVGPNEAVLQAGGSPATMRFAGADSHAAGRGINPRPGLVNYFIGKDPSRWRTNVPRYSRVRYRDVYAGIDVVYYGNERRLEYDLVVAPKANPSQIRIEFDPGGQGYIAPNGDFVLKELRLLKPAAYQEISGIRKAVTAGYIFSNDRLAFQIGAYDRTKPLVIDPILTFATYLGGGSDETAYAVATDASGNTYVAGWTSSTDFPATSGSYKTSAPGGGSDAFVAKYSPTGQLIYATYLGGSGNDVGYGIAVDSSNNVYITGSTSSTDFPSSSGAFQTSYQGGAWDAFLVKLNAAGSALLYSTYLGGAGDDLAYSVALDAANEPAIAGSTASANFPTTSGAWGNSFAGGVSDAFVARLNAAGTSLVFSTYLGGTGDDEAYSVALDSNGNAYVTGYTQSANFPHTAGAAQTANAGGYDAFVSAVNSSGNALIYSTFLGGAGDDFGESIATDSSGNAYIGGFTNSSDYPHTAGAVQASNRGGNDAFVTKLSSAGNLIYSTFLGGTGDDYAYGITVDSAGNAYVTGETQSGNFPVSNAVQTSLAGQFNAFIAQLNTTGTALPFSTFLGGSLGDEGFGIALDSPGGIDVAGYSASPDFPVTGGAAQSALDGNSDAFVVRLAIPAVLAIAKTHAGNFTLGQTGAAYTITVSNSGSGPAAGIVTVTDALPGGLSATTLSGAGWACVLATLTCTRSDALAPGASYPVIALQVNVVAAAAGIVVNQATVSGGGSASASASDVTVIGGTGTTAQTITFPALSNAVFSAAQIALSATASSGLAVSFFSTTPAVCTVSGTSVTLVSLGTCSISANQPGNATYSAAASVVRSFTVSQGTQMIAFGALASVSLAASPVNLTAAASSGLPVSFSSSTTSVCTVSGSTVTLLAVGTCSITASQAGNANYAAAATVTQSFTVNPASSGGGGGGGGGGSGGGGGTTTSGSLTVTPSKLIFTYQPGSATLPASQSLAINSALSVTFKATAQTTSGGNWLSVLVSGTDTTPGSAIVSVNPASLSPGIYIGTITLSSPLPTPTTVPVTLTIVGPPIPIIPALNVSPPAHRFVLNQSSAPASGAFTIGNIGGGTLNYMASAAADQGNWLSLASNATGSVDGGGSVSVGFQVNPAQLAAGAYSGHITVSDTKSGAQALVSVTLVVSQTAPSLQLSQTGVTFTAIAGGALPPSQSFAISNAGGGSLSWTLQPQIPANALSRANWLSVSPQSGSSVGGQPGTPVTISANTAGLPAGQYYGSVNVLASGAVNSPQTVSVLLNVVAAPKTAAGITVSSGGVLLLGTAGDTSTAQRRVTLFNPSLNFVTFTAAAAPGNSWLSVTPVTATLSSGSAALTIHADFSMLAAGLQTGTVTLSFSDGTSTVLQVLAIATPAPASASFRRPNAVSTCTAGKAGSLVSVFDQPVGKAVLTAGNPNTVQAELFDDCGNAVTAAGGGTAQITFSNGDPAITLNDIGAGVWQSTWNPSTAGSRVTLQLSATEKGLAPNTAVPSSVIVAVQASTGAAAARPTGIVNAAAGAQATPQIVAPGSYVAIYGSNFTSGAAISATTVPLPTTLAGTQLLLGGQPLPLFYAGPGQVNAIIPQGLNSGVSYPLLVMRGSTVSVPVPLAVTALQPGIYTDDASGSGQGIVEIAGTTSLAGPAGNGSTPATRGVDYLQIYCTGLGPVSGPNGEAPPADGAAASSTILYRTTATVTATIGGVAAPVQFAGLTPALVALYQVNVQVPANAPAGNAVPLVITATDPDTGAVASSNTVTIALQ